MRKRLQEGDGRTSGRDPEEEGQLEKVNFEAAKGDALVHRYRKKMAATPPESRLAVVLFCGLPIAM